MNTLNVYTEIFSALTTSWNNKTKIVFPNTISSQLTGTFQDTESVLNAYLFHIGSKNMTVSVNPTSLMRYFFALHINVCCPKQEGFGRALGYCKDLDDIFKNTQLASSTPGVNYLFECPIWEQSVPDSSAYVVPWKCLFSTAF